MYKSIDVANFIVAEGRVKDLTPLKLQKLLYFLYGLYWKQNKQVLFSDHFVAWDYGPVVEEIYLAFRGYESNVITQPTNNDFKTAISLEDRRKISQLAEELGKLKATDMVSMSHRTLPWQEAYKDILNNEMPGVGIRRYFETVAA